MLVEEQIYHLVYDLGLANAGHKHYNFQLELLPGNLQFDFQERALSFHADQDKQKLQYRLSLSKIV